MFLFFPGLRRARLGSGYEKLNKDTEDNRGRSGSKASSYDNRYSGTDSHLSSPITEMDEDSDYSWGNILSGVKNVICINALDGFC